MRSPKLSSHAGTAAMSDLLMLAVQEFASHRLNVFELPAKDGALDRGVSSPTPPKPLMTPAGTRWARTNGLDRSC